MSARTAPSLSAGTTWDSRQCWYRSASEPVPGRTASRAGVRRVDLRFRRAARTDAVAAFDLVGERELLAGELARATVSRPTSCAWSQRCRWSASPSSSPRSRAASSASAAGSRERLRVDSLLDGRRRRSRRPRARRRGGRAGGRARRIARRHSREVSRSQLLGEQALEARRVAVHPVAAELVAVRVSPDVRPAPCDP